MVWFPLAVFFAVTHTLTPGWQRATMQGSGLTIGSNLGFSVLPKDTLACVQEEAMIEPWLEDNLLCLLSHRRSGGRAPYSKHSWHNCTFCCFPVHLFSYIFFSWSCASYAQVESQWGMSASDSYWLVSSLHRWGMKLPGVKSTPSKCSPSQAGEKKHLEIPCVTEVKHGCLHPPWDNMRVRVTMTVVQTGTGRLKKERIPVCALNFCLLVLILWKCVSTNALTFQKYSHFSKCAQFSKMLSLPNYVLTFHKCPDYKKMSSISKYPLTCLQFENQLSVKKKKKKKSHFMFDATWKINQDLKMFVIWAWIKGVVYNSNPTHFFVKFSKYLLMVRLPSVLCALKKIVGVHTQPWLCKWETNRVAQTEPPARSHSQIVKYRCFVTSRAQ